jgi:hypothetical protein
MFTDPYPAAGATSDVRDDVALRMLAARDHVRRLFAPEAMADVDLHAPEVVGARIPLFPRGLRRFRRMR